MLDSATLPVVPQARPPSAPAVGGGDQAALRKVAGEFEAFFLGMMLKQMRAAVQKSELFHGGRGEEMFQELLDGEYSKRLAARGGIGLADLMVEQLAKRNRGLQQCAAPGATP